MGAHPPPESAPPGEWQPGRLESWKEIASHLNRTVRTVQRWEREEGLPIHRHSHEQRDSVHALTAELDEWLDARHRPNKAEPDQGVEQPHGFRPRRRLVITVATAVLLLLAAEGWNYWTAGHPALPFAARDWVVLADFENQTGDAGLSRGLGLAFVVSLQQSHQANLLSTSRLAAVLRRMARPDDTKIDEAVGREIGTREGAKALVLPGIAKVGGLYALSARLVDVRTGETVAAYLERARDPDEFLDALGRLATQVRRGLGESIASIRRNDTPLPRVTTRSLEALRAYAEGVALWQRAGYDRALELYTAATQRDPDFAMAHAALGNALMSHVYNRVEDGKAHFERARQLGDRVTERERLAIEARYQAALQHIEQASNAYRAYLASYPDDVEARAGLAYLLMTNGRAEEAVGQYQDLLRASPRESSALINLATTYKNLSRPAEAIPYYDRAFALEPRWVLIANINHEYGFALALTGDASKAREVFARVVAIPAIKASGLRSLALLAMLEGKYRSAAALFRDAIAAADANGDFLPSARNRLFLAMLLHGRGDRAEAIAELDRALESLRKAKGSNVWLAARIGTMLARDGAAEKAERLLAELSPKADRQSADEGSELHMLEGEIALAKGDVAHAIPLLVAAHKEKNWPLTLSLLAAGHDAAGSVEEATAAYEELVAKRQLAAGWEPQQDSLEACAKVAEIRIARGDRAGAARALEPLARLWAEADSDVPLTARLARLQAALR
jgi:tetratricopeptide (TPR) repeat protein